MISIQHNTTTAIEHLNTGRAEIGNEFETSLTQALVPWDETFNPIARWISQRTASPDHASTS
jgi:hypothetical protein